MATKKPKNTLYTLLGKIGDILLIPILLLAFFVSTIILFQNKSDKVPSIFGVSVVRILSSSMEASGFKRGDVVFITKTNTDKLWKGDIIAFYSYEDAIDKNLELTPLNSVDQVIENPRPEPENRVTKKDIEGKRYSVIFHEVYDVLYDESGTRFFQTKGTSNASVDSKIIREDFVVGKYSNTAPWLRSVIQWMSSSVGMVCCVCVPLGILVIFQTLALIEQVNFMFVEKRLIKNQIHWQDNEAQRLIKTGEMEEIVKIIYYTKVDEEERQELKDCLWLYNKHLSKKQIEHRKNVQISWDILEQKGIKEYYLFWKNNLKYKSDIKHIEEEINYLIYSETAKV